MNLCINPCERSADELGRNKLGGRDDQSHRLGSFNHMRSVPHLLLTQILLLRRRHSRSRFLSFQCSLHRRQKAGKTLSWKQSLRRNPNSRPDSASLKNIDLVLVTNQMMLMAPCYMLLKTKVGWYVLKKICLSKKTENFKNKECHEGNCICIVTNYCEVGNIFESTKKVVRKKDIAPLKEGLCLYIM
ncbi:PREDICTED: uncharacterized protein LOC105976834 isoform X2 [Erythranthe guttata]|uniref:uncharacterized protein LOC105976834 isoform X2 n=1 Tax=Erythranthe guttata TaxID=4155 RepID=UPI00064D7A38|nr:PREDICTED: uncharacterized protein LOC105976834 isoform X2 [Erythranthe guttata]|eukprot:XP_012857549.1 PREDICTED: uncharacterized protein LOC105976834 isoform X2 [Erythranthe guttata]